MQVISVSAGLLKFKIGRKDMENNENPKGQLQIDVKPEALSGSYSNLAIISHSRSEFILDFATILPGAPKALVSNRIVMTPENAKRLLMALQDNLNKFENSFGFVDLGDKKGTYVMGFGDKVKS